MAHEAIEIASHINRGIPWRVVLQLFQPNGQPRNLTGYEVAMDLRATAADDSALVAVPTIERDDVEGTIAASLSDDETIAFDPAMVSCFFIGTVTPPGGTEERIAYGEVPVLEAAHP